MRALVFLQPGRRRVQADSSDNAAFCKRVRFMCLCLKTELCDGSESRRPEGHFPRIVAGCVATAVTERL